MAETMIAERLRQLVDRMPGLAWSLKVQPKASKIEWLQFDPRRVAELFDVTEAALARDPMAIMERVDPDDRARFERSTAKATQEATPWSWTGQVVTRAGVGRWVEMRTVVETDVDGTQRWFTLAVDTTERKRTELQLEAELAARNDQVAQAEEANGVLVERLRCAMEEMSNPILEVWDDVLAMPIIGVVDSRRTADMVLRLLTEVARTQASFVIVDLTGVEVVDTKTADHLMKLMRKVEVIGARCVLTGIQPAVAETLVDIGVDFGRLSTLRNLKHGLREALSVARREREERVEKDDFDDDPDEEEDVQPRRRAR